jgi:large subunit ribosomal protein L24
MNRLLIGDEVLVVSGNHKGQKGKVARIDAARGRVIVEGVNLKKRHMKATTQTAGGIVEIPAALAISNVMPLDPQTGKPTRVRFEVRDGNKVRVAKSGAVLAKSATTASAQSAE